MGAIRFSVYVCEYVRVCVSVCVCDSGILCATLLLFRFICLDRLDMHLWTFWLQLQLVEEGAQINKEIQTTDKKGHVCA